MSKLAMYYLMTKNIVQLPKDSILHSTKNQNLAMKQKCTNRQRHTRPPFLLIVGLTLINS